MPANDILDAQIQAIYEEKKAEALSLSAAGHAEACLAKVFELWMFMNRFRNCDLQVYFDEELHDAIARLNAKRFDTSARLREKSEFRIAFIIGGLNDTGGASIPHRFMLERYPGDDIRFRQFVLVTNLGNSNDYETTETYRYLREKVALDEFSHFPPGLSWLEKGQRLEQWLYEREIDFVYAVPCPATLYALASRPAIIHGVMSQDCYTFALGPGAGDFTFLVTTDQVFKYRFRDAAAGHRMKIVMLPLHSHEYAERAAPLSRTEFGIPDAAVISASTNLWKSCFGDSEILLDGIAALIRKFPRYHHVFAGTPRCLDNLEYFLNKNRDLHDRIHFIGPIKNIYRLINMIDFWVNSFPTSGGSDIECALVGKPTIEILFNRNLNLHGAEFLRSRECDVISLDEFVELGTRLITDPYYREDLGNFLKGKIGREFDKGRIVKERIYDVFVDEFRRRLECRPQMPAWNLHLEDTIAYEKRIALYNAYGREHWALDRRRDRLEAWTLEFPSRPFAWIKSLEEAVLAEDPGWFAETVERLGGDLLRDHRIQVMLALGHDLFGDQERSLDHARRAASLAIYDDIPARVAARLLVKHGRLAEAAAACPAPQGQGSQGVDEGNVVDILAGLATDRLPLYYDY